MSQRILEQVLAETQAKLSATKLYIIMCDSGSGPDWTRSIEVNKAFTSEAAAKQYIEDNSLEDNYDCEYFIDELDLV